MILLGRKCTLTTLQFRPNLNEQSELEDQFKALLHKLMTGEIRVADLDLSEI